jgi:hypothetical protein
MMARKITVGWVTVKGEDMIDVEVEGTFGGWNYRFRPDELKPLIAGLREAYNAAKEMGLLKGGRK